MWAFAYLKNLPVEGRTWKALEEGGERKGDVWVGL